MEEHGDMDKYYAEYRAEEYARLNAGPVCAFLARLAFSRWRRALVCGSIAWRDVIYWLSRRGWKRLAAWMGWWDERMLDALFPDNCVVRFL